MSDMRQTRRFLRGHKINEELVDVPYVIESQGLMKIMKSSFKNKSFSGKKFIYDFSQTY